MRRREAEDVHDAQAIACAGEAVGGRVGDCPLLPPRAGVPGVPGEGERCSARRQDGHSCPSRVAEWERTRPEATRIGSARRVRLALAIRCRTGVSDLPQAERRKPVVTGCYSIWRSSGMSSAPADLSVVFSGAGVVAPVPFPLTPISSSRRAGISIVCRHLG